MTQSLKRSGCNNFTHVEYFTLGSHGLDPLWLCGRAVLLPIPMWAAGFTTYLRSLMLDKWRSQMYTGASAANEGGYKVNRGGFSQWGRGGGREREGDTGASTSFEKGQDTGIPNLPQLKKGSGIRVEHRGAYR
jgi:hypothetical protein